MIQEIKIEDIKFDKTQPRKFVDQDKVKDMAQSIVEQGVINPIEVDQDFKIVTGELRYRSAKKAGLKTVPCKVIDIDKKERFERQVVENIHHNTMTAWDTAQALKKLVGSQQTTQDNGIRELSRKIGKSHSWIITMLQMLDSGEDMKKALKANKVKSTYVTEIANAPDDIKDILEKKVLDGDINKREIIRNIKRAVAVHPEKKEEILNMDFKNKGVYESKKEIENVAPTIEDQAYNANEWLEDVERNANKLLTYLKNPPQEITVNGGVVEFNAKLAITKLSELYQLLSGIKGNKLYLN